MRTPLSNITREHLDPVWSRLDISTEKIAAALGVTRQALSGKAHSLGLPKRTKNRAPQTKGDDALFSRMWLAGVSSPEMAAFFGYSHPSSVTTRRQNMGLPRRNRSRGGKTPWAETISIDQFWEMEVARKMQEKPL